MRQDFPESSLCAAERRVGSSCTAPLLDDECPWRLQLAERPESAWEKVTSKFCDSVLIQPLQYSVRRFSVTSYNATVLTSPSPARSDRLGLASAPHAHRLAPQPIVLPPSHTRYSYFLCERRVFKLNSRDPLCPQLSCGFQPLKVPQSFYRRSP